MNATLRLLDLWKAAKGIASDNAAAQALGIARQTVSNWHSRGSQAEPSLIARMATDIGQDAGAWLATVESERARTEADREAWRTLAHRLGTAATLAAVALLLREHAPALIHGAATFPALRIMSIALGLILTAAWASWHATRRTRCTSTSRMSLAAGASVAAT